MGLFAMRNTLTLLPCNLQIARFPIYSVPDNTPHSLPNSRRSLISLLHLKGYAHPRPAVNRLLWRGKATHRSLACLGIGVYLPRSPRGQGMFFACHTPADLQAPPARATCRACVDAAPDASGTIRAVRTVPYERERQRQPGKSWLSQVDGVPP